MTRYEEIFRAAQGALNTNTQEGLTMLSGFILGALWADDNAKDKIKDTPKVYPGSDINPETYLKDSIFTITV